MLTLDPPVRCGAEKFSSPEQYGLLQSHSGEEKSETWQNSYPLMATILLVPHLRAQLGCSLGPKILPAKTRQHETPDCHTCAPPVPSRSWLPPVPLHCPAQLGRVGAPQMEVLMLRGCPSPAALHKIQVAAALSKFSGDLLHHTKFPDSSPKKGFLLFWRTELTQEAGDWGLRSSHVERGDGNKTDMINYCPQRASREVSLVFASHFRNTPGGSEFSGAHLEKYQSSSIFRSAELFSPGNQTSLPHLYLDTQKNHKALSKMDTSMPTRPK